MRIRERAGTLARGYVKTARAFALVLLIAVPFFALATAFAQSSPQGSLTVIVTGSKVGTNVATVGYVIPTGTNVYVEGNLTISGDYTGPISSGVSSSASQPTFRGVPRSCESWSQVGPLPVVLRLD